MSEFKVGDIVLVDTGDKKVWNDDTEPFIPSRIIEIMVGQTDFRDGTILVEMKGRDMESADEMWSTTAEECELVAISKEDAMAYVLKGLI